MLTQPQKYFLYEEIIEIEKDIYVINMMTYRILSDGSLQEKGDTETEKLEDNMRCGYTLDELEANNPSDLASKCREWNQEEYARANGELGAWKEQLAKYPESTDLRRWVTSYETLAGHYIIWAQQSGVDIQNIDAENSEATSRLRLSPYQREVLNEAIVTGVREFIDLGRGTQEQAFENVAARSEELFHCKLSKGQVAGRFKRNEGRYDI